MSFSSSVQSTPRVEFNDAIDKSATSPPELAEAPAALLDLGRAIAKQIAAELPNADAHLGASISGHAPDAEGSYPYRTLSVSVHESAPPAGAGG